MRAARGWGAVWLVSAVAAVGCTSSITGDAGGGLDATVRDASRVEDGGRDAGPRVDAAVTTDAGTDGGARDGGHDGGALDAGPACGDGRVGSCPAGLMCLCCDLGGPSQACLCTTPCTSSTMCTNAERPTCDVNGIGGSPPGLCRNDDFTCCWGCD